MYISTVITTLLLKLIIYTNGFFSFNSGKTILFILKFFDDTEVNVLGL